VLKYPLFRQGECDTRFIASHPDLMDYADVARESERTARLIADISALGYNRFVKLGEYRTRTTPRMPKFAPVLPPIADAVRNAPSPYPRGDRKALLSFIRDSGYVHFTDTTLRDNTQSNSGNRFRLAEDLLVAPYLDNCNFFSLETAGGAHFHVNLMANMTSPFQEATDLNRVAPKTLKQILVRSTNVLGYRPQPRNVMRATAEKICEECHVIRSFDFLNHIENMKPFAEVVLHNKSVVFEPSLSLTYGRGFTVEHYLGVTEEILKQTAQILGCDLKEASRNIILGLKDMAGNCPPHFMRDLTLALRKQWPELVLHHHRHFTDGLFIPAVAEAAKAGAHIIDTSMGAAMRWYGQGEILSTAAYLEELGLKTNLNKPMLREGNFVLKQIMPYYDRYTAPYFQGIDYDVVSHGMPGGATSSSQQGAFNQGYIHLLPQMLRFLAGLRQIVHYHDVTPGSQITWNTAFLGVTGAYRRGGTAAVEQLLNVLENVAKTPEDKLTKEMKDARLNIYKDCNDAFRGLLLGEYGKLPLGFPPDWVYQSAFGETWKDAISKRTERSPLETLSDVDFNAERAALHAHLHREPTEEEFLLYLNHPADALTTFDFRMNFGNPNNLPLDVWFEGMQPGDELNFLDSQGKPHQLSLMSIRAPDESGMSIVRYVLDSEIMSTEIQVTKPGAGKLNVSKADPDNPNHVGAPSNGDLWVMYVSPGQVVRKGDELFNISIMKQEKAVLAPVDGVVKRVLKTANFSESKQMVPVREGELIVELGPVPAVCINPECGKPLPADTFTFCPFCGAKAKADAKK